MTWHPEVLPPRGLRLAKDIGAMPGIEQFYLAGGTGLALQIGHRISADLDFFSSENPLETSERNRLKEALSHLPNFRVREEKEGTLHALAHGIEISFIRYRYPLVRSTRRWRRLRVASQEDIGLMKIGAIIGRGSRKDFRDLREIARAISLGSLLKLAPKKFSDAEDFLFQACKALVYFEDADRQSEPRLLRREPWESVKRWFELEVPAVFKRATWKR